MVTCENEGTKGSAFIPYLVISEVLQCIMHQDAPKALCDAHYKVVYIVWTASQSACSSCGRHPKQHERFTRKCPNAKLISRMLNLKTVIASNICKSCYDFHNQLLLQTSVESVQEDLELRIAFACRCRKIGTVIYCQGGDILYALIHIPWGILNN